MQDLELEFEKSQNHIKNMYLEIGKLPKICIIILLRLPFEILDCKALNMLRKVYGKLRCIILS